MPQQTVVRTVTVQSRYQGWTARRWARHAVANRRALNATNLSLARVKQRLRAERLLSRRRWSPSLQEGIALARAVYGVDQSRRTYCESTNQPWVENSSGHKGALQFSDSTWASTPFRSFSPFDPVAAELAGGWMIRAGRSSEWSCGL